MTRPSWKEVLWRKKEGARAASRHERLRATGLSVVRLPCCVPVSARTVDLSRNKPPPNHRPFSRREISRHARREIAGDGGVFGWFTYLLEWGGVGEDVDGRWSDRHDRMGAAWGWTSRPGATSERGCRHFCGEHKSVFNRCLVASYSGLCLVSFFFFFHSPAL
jgi:hypothetical protein